MKVVKKGHGGKLMKCTGHMGHGGTGCGAILAVQQSDLFEVGSLADPSSRNEAYRCPDCGAISDFAGYNESKVSRTKRKVDE